MKILVSIVTWNSGADIQACLESLQGQSHAVRTVIFDNASSDKTVARARDYPVEIMESQENLGFSRGHNRVLEGEEFDCALLLNADVRLQPDFVARLSRLLSQDSRIGLAGGKLLRMDRQDRPMVTPGGPLLDSTGIFFTPSLRHFDRGGGESDTGQYERTERVFGVTGAALMVRRSCFEDLRQEGEFLDEDFFAYREDADLAWRARLRGWEVLYHPPALAYHRRSVFPQKRREVDPLINLHSVKNRYLMQWKNLDRAVERRCFPYLHLRNLGVRLYVSVAERTSRGAYRELTRLRSRYRAKREVIQSRRRVDPEVMARWFNFKPTAFPSDFVPN